MPHIGIRELRQRASEILRRVREGQEEYVVTWHGRPVALLVPVSQRPSEGDHSPLATAAAQRQSSIWEELETLRDEITRSWKSHRTATELVEDGRR